MKVFIDTNLVLDVLAQRELFYATSARIWELIENGELKGYLSASSITDIFYTTSEGACAPRAIQGTSSRAIFAAGGC